MRITKASVFNFMGIKGAKTFNLQGPVTALCLPNGSGKTSLINAIRYGLTGAVPINPVTVGEEKMAVQLTFDEGQTISRMLVKGKSKAYIGNKQVPIKELDAFINDISGTNVVTMKTITSSELLASMSTKEMGELVLAYIPEELTADTIVSYIPAINENMEKDIRSNLPAGETFGIGELVNLYKVFYERRRLLKKKITEIEGFIKAMSGATMPTESKEEIQARYSNAMKQLDDVKMHDEKMRTYQNAVLQHDRLKKQVQDIDAQLAAIPSGTAEDPEKLEAAIKAEREVRSQAVSAVSVAAHNIETGNKMLANLEGNKCPLSDRLTCTTDKEPLKEEIGKTINENIQLMDAQKKLQKASEEKLAALEKRQADARAILAGAEKRTLLEKQKASVEKEMKLVKIPEKPAPITARADQLQKVIAQAQRELVLLENLPKLEHEQSRLKVYQFRLADYENLVEAFSNTGIVKESIIRFYIGQLADICNEKAEALKPGMKFKFEFSGGLQVTADIKGNGVYLPYGSLSGGEKAYMVYVLMHMFSSLAGSRILFLDELSVLDSEAFSALVKLLVTNQDDYDQAIIATAEHPDTTETLVNNGVQMMDVIED